MSFVGQFYGIIKSVIHKVRNQKDNASFLNHIGNISQRLADIGFAEWSVEQRSAEVHFFKNSVHDIPRAVDGNSSSASRRDSSFVSCLWSSLTVKDDYLKQGPHATRRHRLAKVSTTHFSQSVQEATTVWRIQTDRH